MKQNRWLALGQALKTLRIERDVSQKEIINRSGEGLVERTLRIYESGQQRPSRERLLKFLIRSFELKSAPEINRHLKLAGYAALGGSEMRQFGVDVRPPTPLGKPADSRAEVSTLVVTDGQAQELWRYQFPTRFAQGVYENRDAIRRYEFADIDRDGCVEILFVYVPLDFGSVGAFLFCFSESGELRWQFTPGKYMREDTGREYYPPYYISNVKVIPIPDSEPRILVSSNHYLHNPNQIAMLDSKGSLISEYWHSGHLLSVIHADINGDGIEEILLAGVNNGYGLATLIVFDPSNVRGASTQPFRQLLNCEPGTELAVVLFSRTCLSLDALYNRAQTVWVTKEKRIVIPVVEGVSEAKNPGVMIYELDFQLNVISARPDSHLQEAHRLLEAQRQLDHSGTEAESEQIRADVTIQRRSSWFWAQSS
jgi:hypothetical protein